MTTQLKWYGARIAAIAHSAEGKALWSGASELLTRANEKVPHDEGTLENSGDVDVDLAGLEAVVSYDTPYAARLHEHPEYNFQGGREGKWLENALKNNEDDIIRAIAKQYLTALRGGS